MPYLQRPSALMPAWATEGESPTPEAVPQWQAMDWLSALARLQAGRASDQGEDRLYASESQPWQTGRTEAGLQAGENQGGLLNMRPQWVPDAPSGSATPVPFGDPMDPVSQLAMLLAPGLQRGAVDNPLVGWFRQQLSESAAMRQLAREMPAGQNVLRAGRVSPSSAVARQGGVPSSPVQSRPTPSTPTRLAVSEDDLIGDAYRKDFFSMLDNVSNPALQARMAAWERYMAARSPTWNSGRVADTVRNADPAQIERELAIILQHGGRPPAVSGGIANRVIDLNTGGVSGGGQWPPPPELAS